MKEKIIRQLLALVSLVLGILFLLLYVFILNRGWSEFIDYPLPFILSLVLVSGIPIFLFVPKETFEKLPFPVLQSKKKVLLISLLLWFGGFLYFASLCSFNIIGFDTREQKYYWEFILSSILLFFFLFFSSLSVSLVKSLPEKTQGKPALITRKSIQTSLFVVSLIFMIVLSYGVALFSHYYIKGTIQDGSGYTDGPWLTWYDDPTNSICISYLTKDKADSIVYYGTDPQNLNNIAYGDKNTRVHHVYLTNLNPDTTYYYKIPETFDTPHSSDVFSFKTAPVQERYFKFAVVGDMQPPSPDSHILNTCAMVAQGLARESFDFVCQVGDIFDSGSKNLDYHLSMLSVSQFAAYTPIQAAIGNHDWSGTSGSVNWGDIFVYNYVHPNSLPKYYSFDYLNAHFIMLDNFETFYYMSESQLSWLVEDIRSAHERGQDWVFVFFHLTLMTVSTSGWYYDLQAKLIPIFDREGVDAVFYGHDHDYQHYYYTYGWNNLYYDKDHDWEHHPIHYFCTGGGGADLEVDYGNLEPREETYEVTWYNASSGKYETVQYIERNWNASRYLTHDDFNESYSQYSEDGKYTNKYYYYYPPYENYSDLAPLMGFDYGEQTYHYIQVEINGSTCIISARYPNGELLTGPNNVDPQQWVLTK